MNIKIPKFLLASIAVAGVYLFVFDDEPTNQQAVDPAGEKRQQVAIPYTQRDQLGSESGQYFRSQADPPAYLDEPIRRQGTGQFWEPQIAEPRFRPLDGQKNKGTGYQPDTRRFEPASPVYSYDAPVYDYPDYRAGEGLSPSNPMMGRFRPWDEKRQSKRWHGNFKRMTAWPDQLAAPGYPRPLRLAWRE